MAFESIWSIKHEDRGIRPVLFQSLTSHMRPNLSVNVERHTSVRCVLTDLYNVSIRMNAECCENGNKTQTCFECSAQSHCTLVTICAKGHFPFLTIKLLYNVLSNFTHTSLTHSSGTVIALTLTASGDKLTDHFLFSDGIILTTMFRV